MQNTLFKALAHPVRREILSHLRNGPCLAGDLAKHFDASWPTVSRHISVLKEADLVTADRRGNQIRYHINTSVIEDAVAILVGLTEHTTHQHKRLKEGQIND